MVIHRLSFSLWGLDQWVDDEGGLVPQTKG